MCFTRAASTGPLPRLNAPISDGPGGLAGAASKREARKVESGARRAAQADRENRSAAARSAITRHYREAATAASCSFHNSLRPIQHASRTPRPAPPRPATHAPIPAGPCSALPAPPRPHLRHYPHSALISPADRSAFLSPLFCSPRRQAARRARAGPCVAGRNSASRPANHY